MIGVNDVPSPGDIERQEGQITPDLDILSLGMSDDEIANHVGNRVSQAESFWNQKFNLDNVRKTVDSYYLNNYYSEKDLYKWQVTYKDNRIFVAIETLVAMAISNPPMPQVSQAYDTEASYELAQNLQQALLCKYEDLYLKSKFQMVARHLLMGYRLAVMKYRWDDSLGRLQEDGTRFGDVNVDVLRPQRIVLDAGAQDIDDVPLIAEYRSAPLEELCEKYPNKKDEILKESGKKAGQLTSREGHVEIHTTIYKGGRKEGIIWKYKSVILDNMKSPNWNYDEVYIDANGKTRQANFLNKPLKPYILFNFLNLGRFVIDDTSLMDQAIPLQKIVNKIGRQIVENADQANSGTIWNGEMVNKTDVSSLTGDPGEKVVASGDVREAAARLPYNELATYVREERLDARSEIDNIFATHGAVRGEVTKSKTLGQDVLSQRGDAARIAVLATAIENGADRLYKGITQIFKIFYDPPQLFRYNSEDGLQTSFFNYGSDQIEDNVGLKVKTGSVIPQDPVALREETIQLMGILDPLNIAKGLNKPNPKEWGKQNMMFRLFPDQYMNEVLDFQPGQNSQDPSALQHIQLLNQGKEVPPEQHPTKDHMATHEGFIESPNFQQLPPEIQQLHTTHIEQELRNAKLEMGIGEERPGMPEETQGQEQEQPPEITGTPPSNTPAQVL